MLKNLTPAQSALFQTIIGLLLSSLLVGLLYIAPSVEGYGPINVQVVVMAFVAVVLVNFLHGLFAYFIQSQTPTKGQPDAQQQTNINLATAGEQIADSIINRLLTRQGIILPTGLAAPNTSTPVTAAVAAPVAIQQQPSQPAAVATPVAAAAPALPEVNIASIDPTPDLATADTLPRIAAVQQQSK